ncbi:MAG: alpha/beta hydrolase [Pseudomonadota bacterium]
MSVIQELFVVEDFQILPRAQPLLIRLFRPLGAGPFPIVINLHGGAWTKGDLTECRPRDEAIASAGIASAALDFRHGEDAYPTSLEDVNFAVRWVKNNAEMLKVDRSRVGLVGQSSGGHLAMLAAMRPDDPRYAATALEGDNDASVVCVAMTWPVINPLSRYRHALRLRDSRDPPAWTHDIPARHDIYWKTESNMEEGNPLLALERGESLQTPPALWIQGTPDLIHDYRDPTSALNANEPERFATRYREAGGTIELVYIDQEGRADHSLAPLTRFLGERL